MLRGELGRLKWEGAQLLACLAEHSASSRRAMIDAGAVALLLDFLQAKPCEDAPASALCHLSLEPAARDAMQAGGAAPILVHALTETAYSARLAVGAAAAARCLDRLAGSSAEARAAVVAAGAVPALACTVNQELAAGEIWGGISPTAVQEAAAEALAEVARGDPAACQHVAATGALRAIERLGGSPQTAAQQAAVGALRVLAPGRAVVLERELAERLALVQAAPVSSGGTAVLVRPARGRPQQFI